MDDIDIGVDTLAEARNLLRCIDLVLQTRHIRLNGGKTFIFRRSQALDHFRVRENVLLDSVEARINAKVRTGASVHRERGALGRSLVIQWRKGRFDSGNGEKILKRMLSIARKIGTPVDDELLYEIILRRPGSRASAFSTIAALPLTKDRALLLWTTLRDPQLVDNATFVNAARYLNETLVTKRRGFGKSIAGIIEAMPDDFFGVYSRFWILSKYGSRLDIMEAVNKYKLIWFGDPWLGRLIGGLYPIFIRSKSEKTFRSIFQSSGNRDAIDVYYFHDALRRELGTFNKAFDFLRAPNPSRGTGIMHSKFLLLLSALANSAVPSQRRAALVAAHQRVWADVFYRDRAKHAYGQLIAGSPIPGPPVP